MQSAVESDGNRFLEMPAMIPSDMASSGQLARDGGRPGIAAALFMTYLAALALSCALLGRSLPFPQVLIVRDKIEHLARHGDDYDVIFIGSSHIQSQVLPSVLNRWPWLEVCR